MSISDVDYQYLQHDHDELLKELARLKELNREMMEALERVSKEYLEDKVYHSLSYDAYTQVAIALNKGTREVE